MLTQPRKINLKPKMIPHKASLILLFSLTTNDREAIEPLKSLLLQYHLQCTRLTTQMQKNLVGLFSPFATKANFVAWTNDAISPQQLALLSQVLISKVIFSASFYNGQMWPVSRFQKIQPQTKASASNVVWTSFHTLTF